MSSQLDPIVSKVLEYGIAGVLILYLGKKLDKNYEVLLEIKAKLS